MTDTTEQTLTMPEGNPASFTLEQLLTTQEVLEAEGCSLGEALFHKRLEAHRESNTMSESEPMRRLLSTGTRDVAHALETWIGHAKKQRGARHTALKWVEAVGVRETAYLAVRVVLDGLLEARVEQDVARKISTLMLDDLRFRTLKKQEPGAFRSTMRQLDENSVSHYKHRANTLMKTAKKKDINLAGIDMTTNEKLQVGYKLLDVVQHVLGLCESVIEHGRQGRDIVTQRFVTPEKSVVEWLTKRSEVLSVLCPVSLPMVVPPVEWAPDNAGGYRFAMRARFPMVRGANTNSTLEQNGDVSAVYSALNAAQGTAWRVNKKVTDVIRALRDGGLDLPGLNVEPLPQGAGLAEDADEDAVKEYRKDEQKRHKENRVRRTSARFLNNIFSVIDRVQDFPALYHVHTLDFRSRVYPVTSYWHPQGPDIVRATMEFANGVPVGQEGARWVAIHLANTYGTTPGGQKVSKLPLDERVRWVEENTEAILAVAADPLANRWWTGAEEPWQCLAACYEWAGIMTEGYGYESRLPVAIDGSCNGLQHLAAMLRDSRAGQAVNLIPRSTPADVYTDVANECKAICAEVEACLSPDALTPTMKKLYDLSQEFQLARRWRESGLIGRSLTKRPTMTTAYGSKTFGYSTQIAEWLRLDCDGAVVEQHFTSEEGKTLIGKGAQFMAEVITYALRDVIAGPTTAMDWMQQCARAITKDGNLVEWTVPVTNWRVRQAYYVVEERRVKTMLAGAVVMPRVVEDTDKLDARRQQNAIAPNVVHSLDAACLMLAVQMARAEGVESFGLIHDSYATHAANMPILARTARQAFVRIYKNDVLGILREQFGAQTAEALPPVPLMGDLDLGGVLISDFFFA
jgi:DNA-directed RNA polymerase